MTEAEKKMKKYLKAVSRKLKLPPDVKRRVMNDFESAVRSRKEAGKTDSEIYAELGSPREAAAELNEQMREFAYVKSPWRWVCLGAAALCGAVLLYRGSVGLLAALMNYAVSHKSMGVIGGADGPTVIFVTQTQDVSAQGLVMTVLLLLMSLTGFWALGHMRKK